MMTGTGYARSQRGEEEKKEEGKEAQEAVPEQKRVEKKKVPPKGPPQVAMVDASHLGGFVNIDATEQNAGGVRSKGAKLILRGEGVNRGKCERGALFRGGDKRIPRWCGEVEDFSTGEAH